MQAAGPTVATEFLKRLFGAATEHPVFVCSLPNDRGNAREPGERRLMSRDMSEIESHLNKWDRKDRGFFFCVATLKPGAQPETPGGSPRCKANVSEMPILWADVDLKDAVASLEEIIAAVATLPCPPSVIVASGHGLHLYWLMSEDVASEGPEEIERVLRLLADLVGGDLQVADVARLMRLPGSHNTKDGAWVSVEIVSDDYDRVHHWLDIVDMVEVCGPVLRRKPKTQNASQPLAVISNPFLAVAARFGIKPPIDVERRLSEMSFQGGSERNIHETQLAVTASLLNRGAAAEEVVSIVLDATRAAAGNYGEQWNWRREERELRRMCETWVAKNPPQAMAPRPRSHPRSVEQDEEVRKSVNGASVVRLDERREKKGRERGTRGAQDGSDVPIVIADGVIEVVRQAGQDILLSEGEVFLYGDGVWHVMTPADQQWLQTLIQEGFEALGKTTKTTALAAAWKRLTEHPALFRRKVDWNAGTTIATQNGMLDVVTGAFDGHAPHFYARRKIGAAYTKDARCSRFIGFVESLFADRPLAEREQLVGVIQGFMGAALAPAMLSREERKALLLYGPSRTGKTELSRIFRMLVGEPIASPSISEISERFGLASLYDAAAWIRDDAINEGDDLDPQRFKTIVTGEPIDIERKHREPVRGHELKIPVLLTTNALPRARDKSDAIFNRSLIIEMTNVIDEDAAGRARHVAAVPRGQGYGAHIFATEGAGILNWALEGLRRLFDRGSYDLPEGVRASIQRFKDDNNPVGEWARAAIEKRDGGRVSRHDIMCAYHGWQREQDGDEARALGGRAFWPRFRAAAPWADIDASDHHGDRWVDGVWLTEEALHLWQRHSENALKGGNKGKSLSRAEVNRARPDATRF